MVFISDGETFVVSMRALFALLYKRSCMFEWNKMTYTPLEFFLFFCGLVCLMVLDTIFYCCNFSLYLEFTVEVYSIYISYLTLCSCFMGDACNWRNLGQAIILWTIFRVIEDHSLAKGMFPVHAPSFMSGRGGHIRALPPTPKDWLDPGMPQLRKSTLIHLKFEMCVWAISESQNCVKSVSGTQLDLECV